MALNMLDRAATSAAEPATAAEAHLAEPATPAAPHLTERATPAEAHLAEPATATEPHVVLQRATALPGSATAVETWRDRSQVEVRFAGEVDAYDRHAVVDLLTGCVLAGARDVRLDLGAVTFVDLPVLHALDRVRWHVERVGGRLQVDGLGPTTQRLWSTLVAAHPGGGVGPTLAA